MKSDYFQHLSLLALGIFPYTNEIYRKTNCTDKDREQSKKFVSLSLSNSTEDKKVIENFVLNSIACSI